MRFTRRFTRASLTPLRLALRRTLHTARGSYAAREGWTVLLRDGPEGEGPVGQGEAMPLPAFGTESTAACAAALARWVSSPGKVPAHPEALAEWLRPLEATPAARHALEQAALVLQAGAAGVPLAAWLATHVPGAMGPLREVTVNALLGSEGPEALAAEGLSAVTRGFDTLKVKVAGRPLADDVARLRALRGAVGPEVRLRVDANGGWTVEEAREALSRLGELGLELCEQPVPEAEGLARLRGQVPCRVAADESAATAAGARAVLEAGAVDVLVLKPMVLGGLLPALALAREAAARGVAAFVTSALDGPVARAGAAHAAAVLPRVSAPLASGLAVGELFVDEPVHPYVPRAGVIRLPPGPGLGMASMGGEA